jgi:nitrogenase subunit NifH
MCTVARGRRRSVPEEVQTIDECALPFLFLANNILRQKKNLKKRKESRRRGLMIYGEERERELETNTQ